MEVFMKIALFLCLLEGLSCVEIVTKDGILRGTTMRSRNGRNFHAFFGIPYAEPPVGSLRFQNPVRNKPWKGVRDATILPPPCPFAEEDGVLMGKEDCLYLNLYTPKPKNDSSLLPVMVFIFGGRYMFGHALPNRYGPQYWLDEDIVLITFHFRLAALGFLSTEDEVLPGNYAMKDVMAVLRWVRRSVQHFGGDPHKVTVCGGSSGATSSALSMLSPLNKGLIHGVISQSGSFTPSLMQPGSARKIAWDLGREVGCVGENVKRSEQLAKCMKNQPLENLVKKAMNLFTFGSLFPGILFGPVLEPKYVKNAFMTENPEYLADRIANIPWIYGINSNEGGMLTVFVYMNEYLKVADELSANYEKYFPRLLGYDSLISDRKLKITGIVKRRYFGDLNIKDCPACFSKMMTYAGYLLSTHRSLTIFKGRKYFYYYDHKNEDSFAKMYGHVTEDLGVIHGNELISFYNWSDVIRPVVGGVDLDVSKKMIKLWTNFMRYGDPNGNSEVPIWDPVSSDKLEYLHVANGNYVMGEEFLPEEMRFWKSILSDTRDLEYA